MTTNIEEKIKERLNIFNYYSQTEYNNFLLELDNRIEENKETVKILKKLTQTTNKEEISIILQGLIDTPQYNIIYDDVPFQLQIRKQLRANRNIIETKRNFIEKSYTFKNIINAVNSY